MIRIPGKLLSKAASEANKTRKGWRFNVNKTCNLYANSLFDIGATNDAAQPALPECTPKGAFAWWLRRGRDS